MSPNRYFLFILMYLFLAFGTAMLSNIGEVRPFFNGHWFIRTPVKFEDFGILITEINQKPVKKPFYLDRAGRKLGNMWAFDQYNLEQRIAKAFDQGDEVEKKRVLKILESHLKKGLRAKGVLQSREFDPIEYVMENKVDKVEELGPIEFGRDSEGEAENE